MRRYLRSGLALSLALAAGGAPAQPPASHIPTLRGTVLTGERVDLPAALQGKVGVLVIGFSQNSREQVTAWGKRLAGDYRDSPKVLYFEMPVLASVPRLVRGWVLGKIRGSVPARAQGRFLPILADETEWKTAAAYTDEDDAYVLLVDEHGAVRWRTEGAASDSSYAEVKRRVEEMRPR